MHVLHEMTDNFRTLVHSSTMQLVTRVQNWHMGLVTISVQSSEASAGGWSGGMLSAVVFWKQSEVVLHNNVDTATSSNSDTYLKVAQAMHTNGVATLLVQKL